MKILFCRRIALAAAVLLGAELFAADDAEWTRRMREALRLIETGRYTEAAGQLRETLPLAEQFGRDDRRWAVTTHQLGFAKEVLGQYTEAEHLYRASLDVLRKLYGPADAEVGLAISSLARVNRELGRNARAAELFREALRIERATLGESHPEVAAIVNNLGELAFQRHDFREAELLFQQALAGAAKMPPASTAVVHGNLGVLRRVQGRQREASGEFTHALALLEAALGPSHPRLAKALNNLAVAQADSGDDELAAANFQRAISVAEAGLGREHPSLITLLENYGVLLRRMKRRPEADIAEARSKQIQLAYQRANPVVATVDFTDLLSFRKR